jgi:hypothetical protein
MGRMKYLQRRANRFEFRFPLPNDLAGKPVPPPWPETLSPFVNPRTGRLKTELIRSLQTRASDEKWAPAPPLPEGYGMHTFLNFREKYFTNKDLYHP